MLQQYYKQAGVTSAAHRELLSSLFSIAQVAGGVSMGIVNDAMGVSSHFLLLISFGGSAVSYAMIAYSSSLNESSSSSSTAVSWGLAILMASRVLVGFVKQTMTVATTLLTKAISSSSSNSLSRTHEEDEEDQQHQDRAKYMGRLKASSTMAWIAGPSVGALLYKYVHPQTPALLASLLFVLNMVLLRLLLLPELPSPSSTGTTRTPSVVQPRNNHCPSKPRSWDQRCDAWTRIVVSNLRVVFGSWELGTVVISRLLFVIVMKTTTFSQLGSFYEDLYQLESPHYRGYIASYEAMVAFLVQAFGVRPILRLVGGGQPPSPQEGPTNASLPRSISLLCFGLAAARLVQSMVPSLMFYLLLVSPVASLCLAMLKVCLETWTTAVAPPTALFSVLAGLDILSNLVGISVPLYRTLLVQWLSSSSPSTGVVDDDPKQTAEEPDPQSWLMCSGIHWLCVAILLTLLFSTKTTTTTTTTKSPTGSSTRDPVVQNEKKKRL